MRWKLAQIKGWQCVIPKGRYLADDLVTYIPIDAVIPPEHSDRWGFTKYLSNGRVRCAKLRGEPSFGVIVDREDKAWAEGMDVKDYYGITKYVPPVKMGAGDAAPAHPLFGEYTDVENLRNFPAVLTDGEEVVVTEKLHGTNCRLGLIEGELMAGSMSVRRARPERLSDSIYWQPMELAGVQALLESLGQSARQVILYGEVFGSKVQSLKLRSGRQARLLCLRPSGRRQVPGHETRFFRPARSSACRPFPCCIVGRMFWKR